MPAITRKLYPSLHASLAHTPTTMAEDDHQKYMRLALTLARQSPPQPTNFCVGAVIVSPSSNPSNPIVTTGYTLELPGNTHAEQCALVKYFANEANPFYMPAGSTLYTTMEPCNQRSAGNTPCVDRILGINTKEGGRAIKRVCVGVSEPKTFVGVNEGKKKLEDAGIEVLRVEGFEEEILKVATAGHVKDGIPEKEKEVNGGASS